MDSICKDIFRSIHEGCWIYVEYKNKSEECTKYWIAVRNINLQKKSLEATGLHLGDFTTKNLFLFIEKIGHPETVIFLFSLPKNRKFPHWKLYF